MAVRFRGAVIAIALIIPLTASAQTTWNNNGTDFGTAGNWTNGVPTATTNGFFNATGSIAGTTVNNPSINSAAAVLGLSIYQNQNFGGWTFSGSSSLTLGGTGSTGLITYGPQTTTFNGPTLAGAGAAGANLLAMNVTSGSTLVLAGNSVVTANQGAINVNGGRFVLDNSVVNIANRVLTTGTIKQNGGGTFELIGNAAGGTYNVGTYNTADNSTGGVNTIRVTSNSTTANTTLNFANTGSFSLRQGTRNVTVFSSNGELGAVNGPRITFDGANGTPTLTNGVFANSAATPGFVIVSDSTGVNFATYSTARGVQSVGSSTQTTAPVTVATTAAQLQAFTAAGASGTIGQFNIAANTTETATANIGANTLRITPGGSGSVLAMGTFNLNPAAIMLDGANDFSITGTGSLFGGTHYLYVNNPNATLNLSLTLTTAGNAFVFAGPGYLNLTGTVNQNQATTQRIGVYGGVLRANNTQIGFSGSSQGILNLMGGVLEITGGTNGTGASADFTRPLGATASATSGVVNFNSSTAEQGSGGFSAFGSAASVNIGGSASPTTLQWGATNFVGDGYALKFGSTKSDAVLTFQNGLRLDNGTAYQQREVNVTAGAGGDRTVLSGVVSGAVNADFLKTGTGVLELGAANTYLGNTYAQSGELRVTGSIAGTSSNAGNIVVGSGAMLSGTGTVTQAAGNSTTVMSGGTIRGDSGSGTGNLTAGNVTVQSGGRLGVQLGTGTAASSLTTSTGVLNLNSGAIIDPNGSFDGAGSRTLATVASGSGGLVVGGTNYDSAGDIASYTYQSGDTGLKAFGALQIDVTGLNLVNGEQLILARNGSNQLVLTLTPVPEPASLLAVCGLVVGGAVTVRKLRRKNTPADVTPAV